jgi:hypothetical protein
MYAVSTTICVKPDRGPTAVIQIFFIKSCASVCNVCLIDFNHAQSSVIWLALVISKLARWSTKSRSAPIDRSFMVTRYDRLTYVHQHIFLCTMLQYRPHPASHQYSASVPLNSLSMPCGGKLRSGQGQVDQRRTLAVLVIAVSMIAKACRLIEECSVGRHTNVKSKGF